MFPENPQGYKSSDTPTTKLPKVSGAPAGGSAVEWEFVTYVTKAPNFPEIVCLCGSTRFYDQYQAEYYRLTMEGKIVLSVGFYPHATEESKHGEGVGHDSEQKVMLDELHLRKIDLCDTVFVINKDNYIGLSTTKEIMYARKLGKPIQYLVGPAL